MKLFYNLFIIFALPFVLATNGTWMDNEASTSLVENYCNARYGFCINYPADILVVQEKGDNSDGISLNNSAETITANIYGTFNVFNADIEELYETAVVDLAITQEAIDKGRVVLAGDRYEFTIETEAAVLYQKVILYEDTFVTIHIKALKANKATLLQLKEEVRLERDL